MAEDVGALRGLKVWLVTQGVAAQEGWDRPVSAALTAAGASVESLGVLSALARSSMDVIGTNASKLAKTFRSRTSGDEGEIEDWIRRGFPDLILVDAPSQLQSLSRLAGLASRRPLVVGLVANFEPTAEWMGQPVDAFIAPSSEQLYDLRLVGAPQIAYQVAGPPVPSPWDQTWDRGEARSALRAGDDVAVVLVDVSTMPAVWIDRVVHQMGVAGPSLSVVYYYGASSEAAATLRASSASRGVPARMFGGASSPARAAAGADVVVVGDGAANLVGYVAAGLPLLGVMPGAMTHVLAQRGALVPLPSIDGLGAVLQQIAQQGVAPSHKEALERVRAELGVNGVVEALSRVAAARTELEAAAKRGEQPLADSAGGFEVIGQRPIVAPVDIRTAQPPKPASLSRAGAREELARLIIEERRLERDLKILVDQRDVWMERLADARAESAPDLADFADGKLKAVMAQVDGVQASLRGVQDEKNALRARIGNAPAAQTYTDASRASSNPDADIERRFREMESRRQLRQLRAKMDRKDP